MPHLPPQYQTLEIALYIAGGVVLLILGYRFGRTIGSLASSRVLAQKEQELFTTQRGFRSLYEQELNQLKEDNARLTEQVRLLNVRVEDYRKKAAGLGGLFSSSSRRSDAMYALLLENEALEEALYAQNEKLRQERADALREQLRNTGYRRVLISQLLSDERVKQVMGEMVSDDKRLPAPAPADHEDPRRHEA